MTKEWEPNASLPTRDDAVLLVRRELADAIGMLKGTAALAEALEDGEDPRHTLVRGLIWQALGALGQAKVLAENAAGEAWRRKTTPPENKREA